MKSFLQRVPRLAAVFAFAVASATTLVTAETPQAADAAVFVGVHVGGVQVGYSNYPRWNWGGRGWVRAGYFYGRPGYVGTYGYVGYAPPIAPVFYGRPYYGPRFYGPGFYGRGYYGRGYYGRGFYGRGDYGHGGYGRAGYRR